MLFRELYMCKNAIIKHVVCINVTGKSGGILLQNWSDFHGYDLRLHDIFCTIQIYPGFLVLKNRPGTYNNG